MRTRPNMKMLDCLGTYFALLAYEVAFDKHCGFSTRESLRLSRLIQIDQGPAERTKQTAQDRRTEGERDREEKKKERKTGGESKRNAEKEAKDETGCHVRFLVFPPLLAASTRLRFLRRNTRYSHEEGEETYDSGRGRLPPDRNVIFVNALSRAHRLNDS